MTELFIAIDGVDCIGKDTIINTFERKLKEKTDRNILITRDPGSTERGREARHRLQHSGEELTIAQQVELFNISRNANIEENIYFALMNNDIVLLNRYFYSTIAYQFTNETDEDIEKYCNDILKAITYKNIVHLPNVVILLYSSDMGIIQKRLEAKKDKDDIERDIIGKLSSINEVFKNMADNNATKLIHKNSNTMFIEVDVAQYQNNHEGIFDLVFDKIEHLI